MANYTAARSRGWRELSSCRRWAAAGAVVLAGACGAGTDGGTNVDDSDASSGGRTGPGGAEAAGGASSGGASSGGADGGGATGGGAATGGMAAGGSGLGGAAGDGFAGAPGDGSGGGSPLSCSTLSAGAGAPHQNMQRWLALRYLVAIEDFGDVVAGQLTLSAGYQVPAGWLEANGQVLSQSAYPEL